MTALSACTFIILFTNSTYLQLLNSTASTTFRSIKSIIMATSSTPTLMGLAPELRLRIYDFLLTDQNLLICGATSYHTDRKTSRNCFGKLRQSPRRTTVNKTRYLYEDDCNLSFLRTNKQIRREFLPRLTNNIEITCCTGGENLLLTDRTPTTILNHTTKISIDFWPANACFCGARSCDHHDTESTLPDLTAITNALPNLVVLELRIVEHSDDIIEAARVRTTVDGNTLARLDTFVDNTFSHLLAMSAANAACINDPNRTFVLHVRTILRPLWLQTIDPVEVVSCIAVLAEFMC